MLPEYTFQVLKLTAEFYADYPNPPYTEIEEKDQRRYNCLLIQTHYDYFICVPFRSHVKHKNCFKFKKSARSRIGQSALDYSKAVIIKDTKYLDSKQGSVDSDEYKEMVQNMNRIVAEAMKYVEDYVAYHSNTEKYISEEEYKRRYQFTALQYFHDLLHIK